MIGNDDPLVEQLHGQMTHGGVELIGRGHFENGTAATEDTPLDDSLTERPTGNLQREFRPENESCSKEDLISFQHQSVPNT